MNRTKSIDEWPLLRSALDEMRLPIESEYTDKALLAIIETVCEPLGLNDEMAYDELTESWGLWVDSGTITTVLRDSVISALSQVSALKELPGNYFSCISKLVDSYFLSRAEAIELVENAALISRLRESCSLSFGRISSVVGLDRYPWNVVEAIANDMGFKDSDNSFTQDDIEQILSLDLDFANEYYGDDTEMEAIRTLKTSLSRIDVNIAIADHLSKLFAIAERFQPYLAILQFELSTIEKFDKLPGSSIYEFSPRGKAFLRLWEEYTDTSKSPYLNNAKSVYSLDRPWAKSKYNVPKEIREDGPYRLVETFEILSSLAYPTRKYVAKLVRSLIVRHQALEVTSPVPVPEPTPLAVSNYLNRVMKSNTATKGLFEQRAIDFYVSISFPSDRYRVFGVGASINETNLSTLKLGDVECVDVQSRCIVAYEPHGGSLSDVYVEAHINTLNRVLPLRERKLEETYGQGPWSVTIVFVAHSYSRLQNYSDGDTLHCRSFDIRIEFATFSDILQSTLVTHVSDDELYVFKSLISDRISRLPNNSYLRPSYLKATGQVN